MIAVERGRVIFSPAVVVSHDAEKLRTHLFVDQRDQSGFDLTAARAPEPKGTENDFDNRYYYGTFPVEMTRTPRSTAALVCLVALGLAPGCATMAPPARSSGATLSDEGISLAVVGLTCAERTAGASPSVDAKLAVEVGNPTPDPVIVYPEKMILRAHAPVGARSEKGDDTRPRSVNGGTTEPFTIQFVAAGARCSQEMQLDSSSALEWRGRPVTLAAVRFTPIAPGASARK